MPVSQASLRYALQTSTVLLKLYPARFEQSWVPRPGNLPGEIGKTDSQTRVRSLVDLPDARRRGRQI